MRRLTLLIAAVALLTVAAHAEEYRVIFWNMQSGESSASFLGSQMAGKGAVDFWGLSEVENQAAVDAFVAALRAQHPAATFVAKISEEGGGDRLAIIYRSDRLTAVPYAGTAAVDDIGDNFFEVDSINVGGTVRPALGVQLRSRDSMQDVVALVNHWKCCGGPANQDRRKQQAVQMNAFAVQTPGIPIVAGGDFNIPLDEGGQMEDAFLTLKQIWEYREPSQPDIGTFHSGSVLDAVFVTNRVEGFESSTTILEREGNTPATTRTFTDTDQATDHRPLLLVIESEAGERLEELREIIAELEATLKRLREEVKRLEGGK